MEEGGNLINSMSRKYVEELEKIVLEMYNYLISKKVKIDESIIDKASVIHMGDKENETQEIKKSPYWANLYGRDVTINDVYNIIETESFENLIVLQIGIKFINILSDENTQLSALDDLIDSTTRDRWGDYTQARKLYKSITNPGISTKIRYNDEHNEAYVYLFINTEDGFVVDTPQIVKAACTIILRKNEDNEWKIYDFINH